MYVFCWRQPNVDMFLFLLLLLLYLQKLIILEPGTMIDAGLMQLAKLDHSWNLSISLIYILGFVSV